MRDSILPLLLAGSLLAGCATGKLQPDLASLAPERPALPLPESWYRPWPGSGNAELAGWWQRFDDPQLAALVAQALDSNATLAGAAARLQQARALRDLAGAGLSSQVTVNASAENVQQRPAASQSSYRAGLDASWEPDLYGYRRSGLAASAAALQAEQLTLADGQVSVAAEVALAYIELRGMQQRRAAADSAVRRHLVLAALAATTNPRHRELDRERARAALALSMAELPRLDAGRAQLEHSIALLCGATPGALVTQLGNGAEVPRAPEALAMRLPADTLRQRPDVRAAAARVDAALARLQQADAARKPMVRLEGSIGLHGVGFGGSGSLLRGLFGAISGIAFDGGAGQARVAAGQAAVQESYAAYRNSVLAALREVEDVLVSLGAARERRAMLASATGSAARAAGIALAGYADGSVTLDAVLSSFAALQASEDALALSAVDLAASHVRLYKALGGGWQPDAGLPAINPTPAPGRAD